MLLTNQYSFLLFLDLITYMHTDTLCVSQNSGKMLLCAWWRGQSAIMNLMQQVSDGLLFNFCFREEQSNGICWYLFSKNSRCWQCSPWLLIYNDLHTAAKKPSSPTTLWLSLEIILLSLCVLCIALMAWLTYFSSVKLSWLNKIYSHLFSHSSVKNSVNMLMGYSDITREHHYFDYLVNLKMQWAMCLYMGHCFGKLYL